MTTPPVSPGAPDPLALGLRLGADDRERTASAAYCTPEDILALRAVTDSAWYQAHLATGHVCHSFKHEGGSYVCLDCGRVS